MELNDIIKLVNAGFSKEDIVKLMKPTETQKEEPKQVETPKVDAPKEEQKPDDYFVKLNTAFDSFIERLQKMNINTADSSDKETKTRNANDIIFDIINGGN